MDVLGTSQSFAPLIPLDWATTARRRANRPFFVNFMQSEPPDREASKPGKALKRPSSAERVPLHEEVAWVDASSEEMVYECRSRMNWKPWINAKSALSS
jgi:hypothetical protein